MNFFFFWKIERSGVELASILDHAIETFQIHTSVKKVFRLEKMPSSVSYSFIIEETETNSLAMRAATLKSRSHTEDKNEYQL